MLHSKPVWELGELQTCFSDKKDEIFLLSIDTIIDLKQLPHKVGAFLVIVSDLLLLQSSFSLVLCDYSFLDQ